MEIEQIVSTAKEKIGQTDLVFLTDKTIENYFKRHLPGEGVEPDDAYWALHIAELQEQAKDFKGVHDHKMAEYVKAHPENKELMELLKKMQGGQNADMQKIVELLNKMKPAEKEKTPQEQLLELLGINKPQEKTPQEQLLEILGIKKPEEKPEPNKEILDAIKALTDKVSGMENKGTMEAMRRAAIDKLDDLGLENYKSMWEHCVSSVAYSEGITADKMVEEAKKKFNELFNIAYPGGDNPLSKSHQRHDEKTETEKFLEARREREAARQKRLETMRNSLK